MKKLNTFVLALLLACALPPAPYISAQDMPEVIGKAETLTWLLEHIEQANNEQRILLRDLNQKLLLSETDVKLLKELSVTQGDYVNRLLAEAKKQREIYAAQLSYQKRLQTRSKVLTVSLTVGLPAAAGLGIWAGIAIHRAVVR
jgi:hypothetical protein